MKKLIIVLLFVLPLLTVAQKQLDMGLYKVRITTPEKTVTVEIKPVKSDPSPHTDLVYNWYGSNQIKQTQGGYSGTLLNGQYNEFYANKNLSEQGNFDRGLKDGTWKKWTDNGTLMQLETWKDGVKHGEFDSYDEKGNLKQKRYYKHGALNGKLTNYTTGGKTEEALYKDGKLLPKENPVNFWSRINIFKRKH